MPYLSQRIRAQKVQQETGLKPSLLALSGANEGLAAFWANQEISWSEASAINPGSVLATLTTRCLKAGRFAPFDASLFVYLQAEESGALELKKLMPRG